MERKNRIGQLCFVARRVERKLDKHHRGLKSVNERAIGCKIEVARPRDAILEPVPAF